MSKWYSRGGADNDVILYSKVRLARNLSDTPFQSKMSPEIRKSTVKKPSRLSNAMGRLFKNTSSVLFASSDAFLTSRPL